MFPPWVYLGVFDHSSQVAAAVLYPLKRATPFWRPPIAVVNAFQNFWTFGSPAVDIKISWMLARAGRSGFLGCLIALKPPKMVVAYQAIRTSTAVATFFGMIPHARSGKSAEYKHLLSFRLVHDVLCVGLC